jgi:prepilin-type N-terminal cleavage/methylation domain-containing protein
MKDGGLSSLRSRQGFTMIEMIIVVSLMAILLAISIPSFVGWRENLKYRETAREVASMLREAKSRAITNNQEQQVQFSPNPPGVSTQYGMRAGTRAYMSVSDWPGASGVTNWTILDSQVKIVSATTTVTAPQPTNPPGSIQFTPNGAASAVGTVSIQDTSGVTRFKVNVVQTGRISVTQGP